MYPPCARTSTCQARARPPPDPEEHCQWCPPSLRCQTCRPRRGTDAQRRLVIRRAGSATQCGQHTQSVEAIGQAGQVDPGRDPDTGEQPVPVGELTLMRIDIDDDEADRAGGNADPEIGAGTPPLLDPVKVERGRMNPMTPTAGTDTVAPPSGMTLNTADLTVAGVLRPGARG